MTRDLTQRIGVELLAAVADGREKEAGLLVDYIYGWVEIVLKRGSCEIEDATQEAFITVLKATRAQKFDPARNGKASSWVAKIAVRKAIDCRRSAGRRNARVDSEADVSEIEDSVSV